MKYSIVLGLLCVTGFYVSAQNVDTKKVNEQLAKKDFVSALKEWSVVKKQIQDLASAELMKALPAAIGEFKQKPSDSRGMMDAQGGMSVTAYFEKANKEESKPDATTNNDGSANRDMPDRIGMMPGQSPGMQVTISTNLMMATEVVQAHSPQEGMDMSMGRQGTFEAVRIKGFRAFLRSDQYSGSSGQMIVGGAFVKVEGRGTTDLAAIKSALEAIDCDKLKTIVGE